MGIKRRAITPAVRASGAVVRTSTSLAATVGVQRRTWRTGYQFHGHPQLVEQLRHRAVKRGAVTVPCNRDPLTVNSSAATGPMPASR